MHKLNPTQHDCCRIISGCLKPTKLDSSGCLKPTKLDSVHLLAGISPPHIRRNVARRMERTRQTTDARHQLFHHQPAATPPPFVSMPRFLGHPELPSDPTIDQWLADFDVFVRKCGVPEGERAVVLVDYIGGCAKEEVLHGTRMRFFGTSGPWCLCCGECSGRGRP